MTQIRDRYDVVVAGGGLAGLCLALQLRQAQPELRILVAERNEYPYPDAAHKVGESSVEAGSHYFRKVLGLDEILEKEIRKFGLRFFLSRGDNLDIAERLEVGPSDFLFVPSFQIDRGRFENQLFSKACAARIDVADACRVTGVELGEDDSDHRVALCAGTDSLEVRCRWIVDASGRAALLKKQIDLDLPNRHSVNAAWFRVDHPIDIDDWSDDADWGSRLAQSRRLSTNHLMGPGYWVWLIPLAHGRTSIGIVADDRLHPFSTINTFEKAERWLDRHEPQCGEIVRAQSDRRMDFMVVKHYSHGAHQVFSRDRWCLTGDAGSFSDPLYSPGSDFIGIANGYICDLVTRDLRGENVDALIHTYDQSYRSLARTVLATYDRQYPLMGCPRVMATKIVWDFVMYWGGVALIFIRGKLCDPAFMVQVRPTLQRFAYANIRMQAFFRRWARAGSSDDIPAPGAFVDYAALGFLAELNRELNREPESEHDDALLEMLERNLALANDLSREIFAEATRTTKGLEIDEPPPQTTFLRDAFDALQAERRS